ncbi:unnamed protein product [Choristocarpus tenellus]
MKKILSYSYAHLGRSFITGTLPRPCEHLLVMQGTEMDDPEFETTIDWDEELRKLNAGELEGIPRPLGWDDLDESEKKERAQGKVRFDDMEEKEVKKPRNVTRDVRKIPKKVKKKTTWDKFSSDTKKSTKKAMRVELPSWKKMKTIRPNKRRWLELSRDWRFWVGIMAGVSVLTAILSASSSSQSDLMQPELMVMTGDPSVDTAMHVALSGLAMTMLCGSDVGVA